MTRFLSGHRVALVLTAIACHSAARGAESPRYTVAPAPDWVQSAPAEAPPPTGSTQKASGGTEEQLVDLQVRVDEDTWSQYYHGVSRPTNPSGVSDSSNVSIDFDPELDRLVLHEVTLRRGAATIDELQQGRIEVLQRESKLESGILDGSLTFHLLMSDVRVGDTIEYSYTLEHRDPAWGNRYFARYLLQWDNPIRRLRVRVLSRSHAPLFVYSPPGKEPRKADDGTWQSLEWDGESVPAVKYEKGAPAWYEQYPTVQLSQFPSWKDVVDGALPLFALPISPNPEVAAQAKLLSSGAHSDAERVLNVIRFVQEEIRYTGLELGSGAYQPAQPQEVLKRRYGDCKDKTLLAVALLRDLGIEASPVLVSTRWGNHLHTRVPSPGNFNHAIVKARVQSKTYWLDVTSTAQGGDLQHTAQADLGDGLVIAPGVSALEEMPKEPADSPLVAADLEFDLRDGIDKEGGLKVSTAYRGSEADSMRRTLRRKSPADLGVTYLNYYKGRYDSIRAVEPPKVTDDPRANQITIDESYRVEHFFEADDSGKLRFYLEAETINDNLRSLETPVRSTPYDLGTPLNLSQHIRIRMPEKFPGTDDVVKIEAPQFQYISRVSHSGNDILLDYHYHVLADEVPLEGLTEFVKKRASAKDDTYYRFTKSQEEPSREAVSGAEKQLQEAGRLLQGSQVDKADDVLKALLASDGFRGLSAARQHIAVYLGGVVALEKDDTPRALELLRRATRFDEADYGDWNMRLLAAARAGDHAEATLTLTTLAEHWPENLGEVDAHVIGRVVRETPHTGESRYQLLGALSKASYKSEEGYDLSHWWRDLALLQLEHADQAAAKKTLERLTDPAALISVRADNRFAPIRDGLSLDIPAAIARQVQQDREAVKAHPTKLQPVVLLMGALRQSLDFAGVVQLADDAISAMSGPKGPKVYDDYKEFRVWVLDARGEALYRLGKGDDATAQLRAARQLPEMGNVNVSQSINLAGLYNDLGKPQEARTTLAEVASENVSAYGLMQAAIERLNSADQLGDAAEVEKELALLKEHQQDSISTYQRALISANRQDEAAQLLVSRLQDPDQRVDALLDVQDYKQTVLGPRAAEWEKRWAAVRRRPDVVEAIGKVGNVAAYPMLPQPY
jgi:transglutaminase-like putative cysteine protease/tetratricopeptide (TPR) repeat protein